MNGTLLGVLAGALLLPAGCTEDRPRPGPSGPEGSARLSVEVTAPRFNATVYGGRTFEVVVSARDLNGRYLTGVGYLARTLQGADRIDSATTTFAAARPFAVDTFQLTIPARFATNTQVDIYGVAYGEGVIPRYSNPVSVVVVQCRPEIPGC